MSFAGLLKVEELLIEIRDDRQLLNDPKSLLVGNCLEDQSREADASRSAWTLYPDGFGAERFIEVIETGLFGICAIERNIGQVRSERVDTVRW